MTPQDAPAAASPDPALRGAGGWARPLIEEDLAVLALVRDAALAVSQAIAAQAQGRAEGRALGQAPPHAPADDADPTEPSPVPSADAPAPPAPPLGSDLALAISRATRAVRLTVALRARLIDDLERLDDLQGRRAAGRGAELRAERKAQVARVLTRIIEETEFDEDGEDDDADLSADLSAEASADAEGLRESEGAESDRFERLETEREARDRLMNEASLRLADVDRYGDVLHRPISAFIDHVCRDIGLAPDWRRLAREAWAQGELAGGRAGSPVGEPLQPFSSPAGGGGGPAQLVEGAQQPPKRPLRRVLHRDTSPARGGGEKAAAASPTRTPAPTPPKDHRPPPPARPARSPRPPPPPLDPWPGVDDVASPRSDSPPPPPHRPPPGPSAPEPWPPEPIGLPGEYPPARRARPRPPQAQLRSDWY